MSLQSVRDPKKSSRENYLIKARCIGIRGKRSFSLFNSVIHFLHKTVTKKEESTYREDEKDSQKIATSFVNWFYNILNTTQALPDSENWGPQHFWNDARLEFIIDRPDGTSCDEVMGADEVSRTLALFVSNFKGLFNPNMSSEGVRSEMSHHGLLAVKSAGTIHKSSSVVGLYEQTFGLIQDPLTGGNWKIKNTKLQIKLNSCLSNALSYS